MSRPKYQQKLNKIIKISQEDVILIKKSLSVKAAWCTKAVEQIARQGLETLGSIDSQLKRSHKTGTTAPQPGSGRPRLSHSSEGPCAQSEGQGKKA